jgi:hypothetical protein
VQARTLLLRQPGAGRAQLLPPWAILAAIGATSGAVLAPVGTIALLCTAPHHLLALAALIGSAILALIASVGAIALPLAPIGPILAAPLCLIACLVTLPAPLGYGRTLLLPLLDGAPLALTLFARGPLMLPFLHRGTLALNGPALAALAPTLRRARLLAAGTLGTRAALLAHHLTARLPALGHGALLRRGAFAASSLTFRWTLGHGRSRCEHDCSRGSHC